MFLRNTPSKPLNWSGYVPSVQPPPPRAFDAQGNGVRKGANGQQRYQFVKNVGDG